MTQGNYHIFITGDGGVWQLMLVGEGSGRRVPINLRSQREFYTYNLHSKRICYYKAKLKRLSFLISKVKYCPHFSIKAVLDVNLNISFLYKHCFQALWFWMIGSGSGWLWSFSYLEMITKIWTRSHPNLSPNIVCFCLSLESICNPSYHLVTILAQSQLDLYRDFLGFPSESSLDVYTLLPAPNVHRTVSFWLPQEIKPTNYIIIFGVFLKICDLIKESNCTITSILVPS